MSTPTALPPAALPQLAPATAPCADGYLASGVIRAGLLLLPVPLAAAAAAGPLARVPWPVPAGTAVAGWCALAVLGYLGRSVAARAGPLAATRLVLAGSGAVAAGWSVLLAAAPASLAGADRAAAYAVSLPGLALAGAIAAALATGIGPAVLRWSLPALVAAGATVTGWLPVPGLPASGGALLLAGIGLVAVRAFAPAAGAGAGPGAGAGADAGAARPGRPRGPRRRRPRSPAARRPRSPAAQRLRSPSARPDPAEWRGAAGELACGLAMAAAVLLAWRAGQPVAPPAGVPLAVVLPVLLALPVIEVWIGWHQARVAAGLARYDDRERHRRYAHRLGRATLAGLLPPLVAGAALAATAHRLPYGLSAHPDAPALVLSAATGVLLAGVIATGRLLAARDRPGLAAAVLGSPVLAALALAAAAPGGLVAGPPAGAGPLLPATVVALATGYAAGLVLVAGLLFESRGRR